MNIFYRVIAYFYDLMDVIYFRKNDNNPRKVVLDSILFFDSKRKSGTRSIAGIKKQR